MISNTAGPRSTLRRVRAMLPITIMLLGSAGSNASDSEGSGGSHPPPQMVTIHGGSHRIGSPTTDPGRYPDERLHQVHIDDFQLATRELSRGEFRHFVDATGYHTDAETNAGGKPGCFAYRGGADFGWQSGLSWRWPGYPQSDAHPVVCVSWNDAMAYVQWLNQRTGGNYRLPTEAEWEVAARAGSEHSYSFGDDSGALCDHANLADRSAAARFADWSTADCDDGRVFSATGGQYQPNDNGLYDMHGNVWEWTCSASDADYSGAESRCAAATNTAKRALRGGSFSYGPAEQRLAYRNWNTPTHRFGSLGFRLAGTPAD